jgi:hypothetical protein
VVVFIDEVEEIAGLRQPRTVTVTQGVTNEMLKLIPLFRERDERLLGFPGEVAVILAGVAALCRYRQSSRQRWPWPLSGTRPAT